jgi:hypothetical protein
MFFRLNAITFIFVFGHVFFFWHMQLPLAYICPHETYLMDIRGKASSMLENVIPNGLLDCTDMPDRKVSYARPLGITTSDFIA